MTPREIRAYLRGATRGKVLRGWYFYGPADALRWVVTPTEGSSGDFSHDEAAGYCQMLDAAGVTPALVGQSSTRASAR
jgi:hypothetical protein